MGLLLPNSGYEKYSEQLISIFFQSCMVTEERYFKPISTFRQMRVNTRSAFSKNNKTLFRLQVKMYHSCYLGLQC